MRVLLGTFSAPQLQLINPTTPPTYKAWVKTTRMSARLRGDTFLQARIHEDIEPLLDGKSSLMWLGNREKAEKFVYIFHGGGFISPMQPQHINRVLQTYLLDQNVEMAVALSLYALSSCEVPRSASASRRRPQPLTVLWNQAEQYHHSWRLGRWDLDLPTTQPYPPPASGC